MGDSIEQAVERAIATMRENLGEPITVDDMARAALFSKFHFTRVFRRLTGVSPGRFLSALRLQQAKRLLVSTSLNVADISVRVGYNSVGTFSSRFSRSVGLTPTTYRKLGGFAPFIAMDDEQLIGAPTALVYGQVRPPRNAGRGLSGEGLIFVGLFADRILEGRPVRCTILTKPGRFYLDKVPPGSWYLLTHSVSGGTGDSDRLPGDDSGLCVGTHGPITIRRGTVAKPVEVRLKPARTLDPPVLLALLDSRETAMRWAGATGPRPELPMTG